MIVVADRGMVTKANIELLAGSPGVGWITALKAPTIKKLAATGQLQLSLFDEQNLAEITAPEDYPGERLVVCRDPLVAAERARKRSELLAATERDLQAIAERVQRGTLKGADAIGLAVGPALKRHRMRKHYEIQIADTTFTFETKTDQINAEAALDGLYILRASVPADELATTDVVRAYKGLEQVERAFGTFKGPELEIRPIHHHLEDRVRAHVFLCTLAYYLTWHLKTAWAPLLFTDEQPTPAEDPVAKATRSPAAEHKAQTKRTTTGEPCHSYRSLLAELATLTRKHDPPDRHRRDLPQGHPTHAAANPRARPRRQRARHHVVTTPTPRPTTKPRHRARTPHTQGELRASWGRTQRTR